MLGGIFGSEDLEEKIEELEEELNKKESEIEDLKEQLTEAEERVERKKQRTEKEKERAKEAITEKQSAQRKLKKQSHKMETLRDKLERLEEEDEEKKEFRNVRVLKRSDAESFIERVKSYSGLKDSFMTQSFHESGSARDEDINWASERIDSETGYVGLWDWTGLFKCVLVSPFPISQQFYQGESFRFEEIEELLESEPKLGFASIHAGKSGVGTLKGTEFEDFKVIRGQVKGKHSKGGFSQGRFERIREKQIQEHLEEVEDYLEGMVDGLDYMVINGNERICRDLKSNLPSGLNTLRKNLDITKINKKNLEDYAERIWGFRLYIL